MSIACGRWGSLGGPRRVGRGRYPERTETKCKRWGALRLYRPAWACCWPRSQRRLRRRRRLPWLANSRWAIW